MHQLIEFDCTSDYKRLLDTPLFTSLLIVHIIGVRFVDTTLKNTCSILNLGFTAFGWVYA